MSGQGGREVLNGQRPGDEYGDYDPAGIDFYVEATDRHQFHGAGKHASPLESMRNSEGIR